MTTYYKATRPDGRDFYSGTIDYAAALVSGEVIRHPSKSKTKDDAGTYLSVSVEPADCTGMTWPCRLFRVEPVGRATKASDLRNKRCVSALRVVEELPAHMALGPNGDQVARFIESCRTITREQAEGLRAARDAARDAARNAAGYAARNAGYAARDAARNAAGYAARNAARDAAGYAAGNAAGNAAGYAAWYAAWDAAGYAAGYAAGNAARNAAGYAAWDAAWDAARNATEALVARDRITPEQFGILTGPWVKVMGETWGEPHA